MRVCYIALFLFSNFVLLTGFFAVSRCRKWCPKPSTLQTFVLRSKGEWERVAICAPAARGGGRVGAMSNTIFRSSEDTRHTLSGKVKDSSAFIL